ncbi:MAG: hypothetical protein AAGE52_01225 [Myxococcota bacterium]
MAHLASEAIIGAIRCRLEEGADPPVRAIPTGTYGDGVHEGQPEATDALRALVNPRVEVIIASVTRAPQTPPQPGNLILYDLVIEVRCVRSFTAKHSLDTNARAALRAAMATDADVIAQALTYPGALRVDGTGETTGLVSGMLRHTGSVVDPIDFEDGQGGRLVTTHSFSGVACVAPATA